MTQEFLLDAIIEDLLEMFKHTRLSNSLGVERAVRVYAQDVPVRQDDDEGENQEAPPEPYVLVRIRGGKTEDDNAQQVIDAAVVACVYDEDENRQGFRDALHIINTIYQRYSADAVIGKRWEVLYPIEWATQEEDTHPYYFVGMSLRIQSQAVHKEVPDL